MDGQFTDHLVQGFIHVQAAAGVDVELNVCWLWFVPDVQGNMACLNHYYSRQSLVARLIDVMDKWARDFVHSDIFDKSG